MTKLFDLNNIVCRLVLQAVKGEGSVEQSGEGLLQKVRKELRDPVGEEEMQELNTFLAGSTHTDQTKNTLLKVSGHLCQSLPPSSLQSSLGHVGLSLLGQPLDWQRNWPELRSIQSMEGLCLLNSL